MQTLSKLLLIFLTYANLDTTEGNTVAVSATYQRHGHEKTAGDGKCSVAQRELQLDDTLK